MYRYNTIQYNIHSFIQAISIVPLQVHIYSEAFPTQHGYRAGISRRSSTGSCKWRTCPRRLRGGYRAGVKPMALRTKGVDSTNAILVVMVIARPTCYIFICRPNTWGVLYVWYMCVKSYILYMAGRTQIHNYGHNHANILTYLHNAPSYLRELCCFTVTIQRLISLRSSAHAGGVAGPLNADS